MTRSPTAFRNRFEFLATRDSDAGPANDDAVRDAHMSVDTPLFRRHASADGHFDLARCLVDEDTARLMMERLRWQGVTICPHCATSGASRRLNSTAGRSGLWRCGICRRQFTVTVGTALSSTRIPLHLWVYSIHMLCSSGRGLSAAEIGTELGVSYNSARAVLSRILHALDLSDEEGNGIARNGQESQRIGRVSLRPRTIPEVCKRLLEAA
ncbi:MAG: IS1595 family transposase [Rhodospirillaceae bacterium]